MQIKGLLAGQRLVVQLAEPVVADDAVEGLHMHTLYGSCLESKKLGGGFDFLNLTSFQGVRRGYETGLP